MVSGTDQVLRNLDAYTNGLVEKATRAMTLITAALEGWAKSEHTYQDRTSNLTNSIFGSLGQVTGQIVTGYVGARMEYAWAVELARSQKWAFIWPTIENHLDDIQGILEKELGKKAF
jgi:hypothetical protein